MQRAGVVLSTGDLRGVFAHTGFLLALEELGILYQAMAGSSAGAIVAGEEGVATRKNLIKSRNTL